MAAKRIGIFVTCEEDWRKRLRAHSKANGKSMAAYIRDLATAQMERAERGSGWVRVLAKLRLRRKPAALLPPPR